MSIIGHSLSPFSAAVAQLDLGRNATAQRRTQQTRTKEMKTKNKMKTRIALQAVGILAVSLILVGCAEVGLIGSKYQSFEGTDSMVLEQPRADILDVIADVGKSMKFDVSGLDKNAGQITLSAEASMATGVMIGKMQNSNLFITTPDGGKNLAIRVSVTGNFGTGGKEAADKLVADFKAKLTERLRTR